MAVKYSIKTCKHLEAAFQKADLHRPMRVGHYDAGIELKFPITPVEPGPNASIRLSSKNLWAAGLPVKSIRSNCFLLPLKADRLRR